MHTALRNARGFTLVELVIVIVLLGALTATAVPIFTNLQDEAAQAAEKAVIGSVRSAIGLKYAETAVTGTPTYPAKLDATSAGTAASESTPFFVDVLIDPIVKDWKRDDSGFYIGPAGGRYEYDPSTGRILER